MDIVVLSDFGFVSGGAAAVAIASAKGFAARGHRVVFFAAVGPADPGLRASGVEVVDTGQRGIRADTARTAAQLRMAWNVDAARLLLRRLSALDPRRTVVHLHGWTKALSSSVARAAVSGGFGLVCTLHDYAIACPRGSFFDRATMDHCRRRPLSPGCMASDCGREPPRLRLFRTLRHAAQRTAGGLPARVDAFVFVSRLSRTIIEPHLPPRSLKVEIANPVDAAPEAPARVADNRALVMVGRLTVEKGALLLARAARDRGLPVVFVGDGPCRAEVASIDPSAEITGWLPAHRVRDEVRRARALVFPSLWYETQGLVVPEAAALGVPAVVSHGCAAAEGVRDGETGLIFRSGDQASLGEALGRLSHDGLASRLGAACHAAYWRDPPTLERHLTALEGLYRTVLEGRSAGG